MFCHGCQNMERQPIGLGHVDGHEFDAAFHEVRDKGNRASKTVQLGDYQDRPLLPAEGERCGELRPVVLSTTFHFHELAKQISTGRIDRHGRLLRLETKAALPLPFGRDSVIGNQG